MEGRRIMMWFLGGDAALLKPACSRTRGHGHGSYAYS